MKNTVAKIALALVAVITMTGCPGKPKNNNFVGHHGYGTAYNYGGAYCQTASCYGTVAGYGQMFASGLGKINSSHLQAEVALNFSTTTAVNPFVMNSYSGNTQMIGTLNVYSASGFCPIQPGQYQLYGTGTFGSGMAALSFTGTITGGGGMVSIQFPNNFITPVATTSIMGPTFPFAIQNSVYVSSPFGSCGVFVME